MALRISVHRAIAVRFLRIQDSCVKQGPLVQVCNTVRPPLSGKFSYLTRQCQWCWIGGSLLYYLSLMQWDKWGLATKLNPYHQYNCGKLESLILWWWKGHFSPSIKTNFNTWASFSTKKLIWNLHKSLLSFNNYSKQFWSHGRPGYEKCNEGIM